MSGPGRRPIRRLQRRRGAVRAADRAQAAYRRHARSRSRTRTCTATCRRRRRFRPLGPIPPYLDALVTRATARDADPAPARCPGVPGPGRRVKAALQQGLLDDPELTQELTAAQAAATRRLTVGADRRDRADYEVTQLVRPHRTGRDRTAPPAGRGPRTVPPTRIVSTPTSAYSPPTVFDAPPPAPIPQRHTPTARAAQRERQARKRRRGWLAFLLVLLLTASAAPRRLVPDRRPLHQRAGPVLPQQGRSRQRGGKSGLRIRLRRRVQRTSPGAW